jgi:hypothetical protein
MPGVSRPGVFLSYRRDDAGPYARSLQLQLSQRIPDVPIFMDLDSIEPGLDFAEVIEEAVNSSAVLVALIGRQWATVTDEDGGRRLDSPDDYVRFELKTALEHRLRVIPVLVDGARPLRQQQLPSELSKLARLNALELSYGRYDYDAGRLLDLIERVLAAAPGTAVVPRAPAVLDAGSARPDESFRPPEHRGSPSAKPRPRPLDAAKARRQREVRDQLKRGAITLPEVIADATHDDAIGAMQVSALLEAMPGLGKVRAKWIMEALGIAEGRSVRQLGRNQKAALINEFGETVGAGHPEPSTDAQPASVEPPTVGQPDKNDPFQAPQPRTFRRSRVLMCLEPL